MQINIQSWAHPSNHVRLHNNSMVWMPYNVDPFGATFPVLDWCNVMRMEYPLGDAQVELGMSHLWWALLLLHQHSHDFGLAVWYW